MSSLRRLEEQFAELMLNPGSTGVAPAVHERGIDPARRFRVYRNNIVTSLTAALRACYPVVERLIGEQCFRAVALSYLQGHPCPSGNLHDFGALFPRFLRGFAPGVKALVYLPDVARLEWARQMVYHAADTAPLDWQLLEAVPARRYGELRFAINPAVRLLVSPYPVLRIWDVNQPEYRGDQRVDLAAGGERVLVARRDLTLYMEGLCAGEFALLTALGAGKNLIEAAARALNLEPGFDLPAALQCYVRNQTLIGFHV